MVCANPGAQARPQGAPPIRVESHEVLIPVLVIDKKRLKSIHEMNLSSYESAIIASNSHLLLDLAVTGLLAADFRLFEDGKEQQVEHVTSKDMAIFGEDSTPGVGPVYDSGNPSLPGSPNLVPTRVWPEYILAYSPPPSLESTCHKIRITVDRPDTVVYARSEYCNMVHAPNDSLNGMRLGNQLLEDLDSPKETQLTFLAVAFPSLQSAPSSYTDIALDAPEQPRILADCAKPPEIGVLGLVYAADGSLAARFSGLTLGDASERGQTSFFPLPNASCTVSGARAIHERVDLPPGEYKLRAVIRDGNQLGKVEIPITVARLDRTQMAVSNIVLGKNYRQVTDTARDELAISPGSYVPLVSKGWEIIPTVDTTFKRAEFLTFYVEVYSPIPAASPDRTVQVHVHIVDAGTGQVVKELRPMDTASYSKPGDPVIPVGGGVDIGDLATGSYRLEVQATDSSGQSTGWRSAAFRVAQSIE